MDRALELTQRESAYVACAAGAMAGISPPLRAAGEQPKFLARLDARERRPRVLVKVSPPRAGETAQRWGDPLRCEPLGQVVRESAGIASCGSRRLTGDERTPLEFERFDRLDTHGHRGVVSLYPVDLTRHGKPNR